jgi:hypothetical protein
VKLIVQRGHVPRTTGAVGTSGEQQLVTAIAAKIVQLASAIDGLEVAVIDADVARQDYRGDAFIALHADGAASPQAAGASVGYATAVGRHLARAWKAAYAAQGFPGTFRTDNYTAALSGYYGVRAAIKAGNRAACIVEHGFLTNPAEREWMTSPTGIEAAARAALIAATNKPLPTIPKPAPPPPKPTVYKPVSWQESAVANLPTISQGASGIDVRRCQSLLGANGHPTAVDGVYGPQTTEKVRSFQTAKKLSNDGVCGRATWSKLLGV